MAALPPTVDGRTIPDRVADLELRVKLREGFVESNKLWGESITRLLEALTEEVAALREQSDAQAALILGAEDD